MPVDEVAGGGDKILVVRSEDVLLGMCVYPGGPVLCQLESVEVNEKDFQILLVLVEEGSLDALADAVHLLQAHLFLLLVQPEGVEVKEEFPPVVQVQAAFLVLSLLLLSHGHLVGDAYSLKPLQEVIKVDTSAHEVAIHVQTP